jgi:hypothetical protein
MGVALMSVIDVLVVGLLVIVAALGAAAVVGYMIGEPTVPLVIETVTFIRGLHGWKRFIFCLSLAALLASIVFIVTFS